MLYLAYVILFLSLANLLRMAYFSIASDLFDIKSFNHRKDPFKKSYLPLVTIAVPAHNEELTLGRNLQSIADSTYKKIQLIVINDGSTDKTLKIAKSFKRKYKNQFQEIIILNTSVRGKARALNKSLGYAKGALFMCLDADSALTTEALSEAVKTFRNKKIGALSANVKIAPVKGILNIIQRIEYLICYQMKKAETFAKIQYIIGGIGSMYRTKLLRELGIYQTDTITEDIDLSMRLIEKYGDKQYIGYNPAVVVFTQAATSVKDLLKQRFRWKYGRYQVFLKRRHLFWSTKLSKNRALSWVYLPYALFSEVAYTLEPIIILFIIFLIFFYGDFSMIIGSLVTFCLYTIFVVTGVTHGYSKEEKIKLALFSPLAFIFMYVLSFVEYVATIRGFLSFRKLWQEYKTGIGGCDWTHVARSDSIKITS